MIELEANFVVELVEIMVECIHLLRLASAFASTETRQLSEETVFANVCLHEYYKLIAVKAGHAKALIRELCSTFSMSRVMF